MTGRIEIGRWGGYAMDVPDVYDLLVIGGGINGVGIARDAPGRGLSVALVEQDDLGSHTSSARACQSLNSVPYQRDD